MKPHTYVYLLPQNHPTVLEYADFWKPAYDPSVHTLTLQVLASDVQAGNCGGVHEIIIALQHQPQLIEKLLFSIGFEFVDDVTDEKIPEEAWKADPIYYEWFFKLMSIPSIHFFIADEDARAYSLLADLINNENAEVIPDVNGGRSQIGFAAKEGNIILRRLFKSCVHLLVYCHNCDFNPQIYIEGVMALYDAPFSYQEVLDAYELFVEEAGRQLLKKAS